MRKLITALAVASALLGLAAPSQAGPWGWYPHPYPYPYGYPYAYPYPPAYITAPPVVVQPPAQPPVIIQQQQPAQQQLWYYCQDAKAYYPYVQQCPSGWMQVLPQTTPPAGSPGGPATSAPAMPR